MRKILDVPMTFSVKEIGEEILVIAEPQNRTEGLLSKELFAFLLEKKHIERYVGDKGNTRDALYLRRTRPYMLKQYVDRAGFKLPEIEVELP